MLKFTSTPNAPSAIGPYSQAVAVNGILFTSGQVAIMPGTGEIVGTTIEEQAEQVCKNLGAILEANGIGFDKVIKTTCFLADMNDFATFNEVYGKYFVSKPARSCVAVKTLPKNLLCEVEVIAEL
ncbi:MAG: RidA family protein [Clostridiales bacterium]|nr:RidA family protein [Clostridiales bacterium]